MTDLEKLKEAFESMDIYYKESMEGGYTFISPCSEDDTRHPVNTYTDRYFEFDEEGSLASY